MILRTWKKKKKICISKSSSFNRPAYTKRPVFPVRRSISFSRLAKGKERLLKRFMGANERVLREKTRKKGVFEKEYAILVRKL